jgi:hypothetical protein
MIQFVMKKPFGLYALLYLSNPFNLMLKTPNTVLYMYSKSTSYPIRQTSFVRV